MSESLERNSTIPTLQFLFHFSLGKRVMMCYGCEKVKCR